MTEFVGMRLRHPDIPGAVFTVVAEFPPGEEPMTVHIRREDGLPFTWGGQASDTALLDVRTIGVTWEVVP